MATIKNYTRSDRLADFKDACADFAAGGELNGKQYDSLQSPGAIDALWTHEIVELVEMNQVGKGALLWPPLNDSEKASLFNALEPRESSRTKLRGP